MERWKITIEYDGTPFHGWQKQEEGLQTVQSALEKALFEFSRQNISLHAAGRTDTGVSSQGQVAHFDIAPCKKPLSAYSIAKALNALVRPLPIAVLKAEKVADDFHARFHAKNKLYIYRCVIRPCRPVMDLGKVWHIKKKWDIAEMQKAIKHLIGHHDFTTFRATGCQAKHPNRTLESAHIEVKDYDTYGGLEVQFHFEAQSFLHHQVRNMVGTLSLVGEGKWSAEDVKTALEAKDRTKGGPTAPPDGLSLVRIDY